ncbi:methylated-DNA--[protein]-cysteine S-methyltransferase [Acidothermaceae bacterium B102]|nr:methylated-DNA--[protein]-cysteine S-methyltransferase [Acidothermaceae bacterium B102]
MINASTLETPAGPLTVLVDGDTVVAAGFTSDVDRLFSRLPQQTQEQGYATVADLGATTKAVLRWLDGDLAALDEVAVQQAGTPYQQAIWNQLTAVPLGETVTYGELAVRAGKPAAARAAGSACGANLIAPFVPCHRALRSTGALGGYEYGLEVKQWLLAHEAQHG